MAKRRPRKWNFTPYQPPLPPAGMYDPGLDAQRGAANRGYADLVQDLQRQGLRETDDYGLQTEDINRQRTQRLGDIQTALNRGGEDYARNVGLLTRRYNILGRNQLQQANTAGVLRGGAVLQAAARRAANQGIERQGLDTAYTRQRTDLLSDYNRTNENADWRTGLAGLGLQRGDIDRSTQFQRAGRENAAFGLDIGAQQAYQAAGAGWVPEQRPSNEFVDAQGRPYRVVMVGNRKVRVGPNGRPLR